MIRLKGLKFDPNTQATLPYVKHAHPLLSVLSTRGPNAKLHLEILLIIASHALQGDYTHGTLKALRWRLKNQARVLALQSGQPPLTDH